MGGKLLGHILLHFCCVSLKFAAHLLCFKTLLFLFFYAMLFHFSEVPLAIVSLFHYSLDSLFQCFTSPPFLYSLVSLLYCFTAKPPSWFLFTCFSAIAITSSALNSPYKLIINSIDRPTKHSLLTTKLNNLFSDYVGWRKFVAVNESFFLV